MISLPLVLTSSVLLPVISQSVKRYFSLLGFLKVSLDWVVRGLVESLKLEVGGFKLEIPTEAQSEVTVPPLPKEVAGAYTLHPEVTVTVGTATCTVSGSTIADTLVSRQPL